MPDGVRVSMKLKSLVLLVLGVWAVSACGEETRALETELAPEAVRSTRQFVRSQDKVLLLANSVAEGMNSREALAVRTFSPSTQVVPKTPDEWRAMTAQQFMEYRALIIGDAACQSGTAAFDAAVETRSNWGAIVDSNVVLISSDPTQNNTEYLVENAIKSVVLDSIQYRTGMYIALGCAYQNAPANTVVTLLEPFGTFKVQGVPGCADSAHMFQMYPPTLSEVLSGYDQGLGGTGCAARSVFTEYPEHTFSFAAVATRSSGAPIPGQRPYIDYQVDFGTETVFQGTPYVLIRGANAWSAGCGDQDSYPVGEECDSGDGTNGQPAGPGQDPLSTCSFSCHLNWCGDGHVDVAQGEECDNGINNGRAGDVNADIGPCTAFCKNANVQPPNRPPVAVCRNITVSVTNTCGAPANINNGSSDPDGDAITCTQNPPGPYNVGTTTVVLSCTDPRRGSNSCTGTVTVADSGVPTVSIDGPASQALECARGATYAELGATASDLCEGSLPVSLSGSVNMGAPATYTLTYTARDSAGNQGSASRTVVVSDSLPPSVSLLGTSSMAQECGVVFTDPGAIATDQCAGTLPTTVTGLVNERVRGSYLLTYSANDGQSHTASKDRTVVVRDTRAPVVTITGPLSLDVECRGGPFTDPGATANDLCAGPLTALPTSAADPNVLGTYSISYQATDPDGNVGTSSDSRTVRVRDTLKPVLTLTGANPQPLECGTAWANPGATATDQCMGPLTGQITVTGSVDHRVPRQYTVTYSVSDGNGNTETRDRAVSVSDTLPPTITVVGPLQDSVECGSAYVDGAVRAEDVCAGTLPVTRTVTGDTRRPGTMSIEYSAIDPSGNPATAAERRTVTVQDTLPPTLSLRGTATQRLECGSAYTDPGAVAMDVCFGDVSSAITQTGSVNPGAVGDYTVLYAVTDGAGNRATALRRTVEVRDTLPPALTVLPPLNTRVECDHQAFQDPGATARDVCAQDLTGAIQRQGQVDMGLPGTYSLSYRVADPSGNEATVNAARTVAVEDSLPPTIELVGAATESVECGAAYVEAGVRASDLCAGDLSDRVTRVGTVNPARPGDYPIVYSVTDPSNHTATTRRDVAVKDTTPPSIVCPDSITVEVQPGMQADLTPAAARASDVCSQAQVFAPTQTRFAVGDTTLTYTARDEAGNTASCTTRVTVREFKVPDPVPEPPKPGPFDRALLGGGSGCSSTSSGPSSLAMMGLGVLAAFLARRMARRQ